MQVQDALLHHVFFWLKNPASGDDRQKLVHGLRRLKEAETIKSIHIGMPASTPVREVIDHSYDVSLLLTFKSIEDHNIYQEHPIHQEFIESCAHLWKTVRVYDTQSE